MSKVTSPMDAGRITDTNEFMRFTSRGLNEIIDTINGNLDFDSNMTAQHVDVTFTVANVDVKVSHKLKKAGVKYIPSSKSATCDIYTGSSTDSTDFIYLRSTAAASVTLLLYVRSDK